MKTKKQLRKKVESFDEAKRKAQIAYNENPSPRTSDALWRLIDDCNYWSGKLADWEIDRNRIQS